ncbi:uncharacterized protein DUF2771 [Antricoccus suffuscus]|uniref:Uncharacterized protein DUF2771 n=1 Tax=Antricoccus suffuscus TaxID=1629062 RepID=A0A2T0ZXP2_9ACTN|nr:DUF2771 family protein [Antricoccus suffuscus]PRZ41126.1 uncharacterized protein DUF2771 [Antricoccus suffuscus]
MSNFPLLHSAPRTSRIGVLLTIVLSLLLVAGCSSSAKATTAPDISVTIDHQTSTIPPSVYCIDNKAQVYGAKNEVKPIQVQPKQSVSISVPAAIADKTWSVQIWSVTTASGKPIPERMIGNVDAGKARKFTKINTSDAVPDRVYLMITIPQDPKCNAEGAAGLWPILLIRQAA